MTSNDNKDNDDNKNVVEFKKPAPKTHPKETTTKTSEPLINIPPFTKYLLGTIIFVHLIMAFLLSADQQEWVISHFGFTPGHLTGVLPFESISIITPFTSQLIHGDWLHLGMNTIMLLAFGAGIERWLGGKKMIAFFVICGLFGMALHFALNFHSTNPVVGASGGISGLFAAALIIINKTHNNLTGRFGLWPIIILWIGISVIFGFVDTPQMGIGKGEIAWAAHVGGFLGGFATLKMMKLI